MPRSLSTQSLISKSEFPKLNGTNLHSWKMCMQMRLRLLGLEDAVTKKDTNERKQTKAFLVILSSIEPEELENFCKFLQVDKPNVYIFWEQLETYYKSKQELDNFDRGLYNPKLKRIF